MPSIFLSKLEFFNKKLTFQIPTLLKLEGLSQIQCLDFKIKLSQQIGKKNKVRLKATSTIMYRLGWLLLGSYDACYAIHMCICLFKKQEIPYSLDNFFMAR